MTKTIQLLVYIKPIDTTKTQRLWFDCLTTNDTSITPNTNKFTKFYSDPILVNARGNAALNQKLNTTTQIDILTSNIYT